MVAPSSTSEAWNSVYCCSGSSESSDGISSCRDDAVERPAVRGRDCAQLFLGFGQRDVEDRLTAGGGGLQDLHRQRRLARARHAFDEEEAVARQPAGEDVVEARNGGGCEARGRRR